MSERLWYYVEGMENIKGVHTLCRVVFLNTLAVAEAVIEVEALSNVALEKSCSRREFGLT